MCDLCEWCGKKMDTEGINGRMNSINLCSLCTDVLLTWGNFIKLDKEMRNHNKNKEY